MLPSPRSRQQRLQDTLDRFTNDVDVWVATAAQGGEPYLVPLSFLWDGEHIIIATPETSPTGRNLLATGNARLSLGPTRDVVLIDATLHVAMPTAEADAELGDAFAEKAGFDPRRSNGYRYFSLRPLRIQAWREVNELAGRDLMRGGAWLGDS